MWALYAILIVGTVLSIRPLAEGCTCPPENHPQQAVCKADFVLTGKRQGTFQRTADIEVGLPPSFDIVFNVKVTKAIKIPQWPATRFRNPDIEKFYTNLCNNTECRFEEVCEKTVFPCLIPPCPEGPTCVPTNGGLVKDGLCPFPELIRVLFGSTSTFQKYRCNTDFGCNENNICCHGEESSQCRAPLQKLRVKKGDTILVQTGASSAACGVAVSPGEEWLFSGKVDVVNGKVVFKISLCGWNIKTAKLTRQQKRYLRSGRRSYFGKKDQNCKQCNIFQCPNNDCSLVRPAPRTCLIDKAHGYSEYYRCEFKKARKGQPERCEWSTSGRY